MANNPEMASNQGKGEGESKPVRDLATALAKLVATIDRKEFFVTVRWPQTDLTATALLLRVALPQIDIHLGPETSGRHHRGLLQLRIPPGAYAMENVPSEFLGAAFGEPEVQTEWNEFAGQGSYGVRLLYPLSRFDPGATQAVWIASDAKLLETMLLEATPLDVQ